MENLKHTKFQTEGLMMIRKGMLLSGNCVVFGIPLVCKTILNNIDFDAKSDYLLQESKESTHHRVFEYSDCGFVEVDKESQNWFKFN